MAGATSVKGQNAGNRSEKSWGGKSVGPCGHSDDPGFS